jgi:hypothetical protein
MNPGELLWPALLGMAGLIFGSFIALLTVRLPRGEGVLLGRSRCPRCGSVLNPLQLIPLLSYALQRGRCRSCSAPISRRYPAIEAGCALMGVWAGAVHPDLLGVAGAGLGWTLLLIAVLGRRTLLAAGSAHPAAPRGGAPGGSGSGTSNRSSRRDRGLGRLGRAGPGRFRLPKGARAGGPGRRRPAPARSRRSLGGLDRPALCSPLGLARGAERRRRAPCDRGKDLGRRPAPVWSLPCARGSG